MKDYGGSMYQPHVIFKRILISVCLIFCCDNLKARNNVLLDFEKGKRYSDIIQIGLSLLGGKNCLSIECQKVWLNNLGRASLLLGDTESAKYYLSLNRDSSNENLTASKLLSYSYIVSNDFHAADSIIAKLKLSHIEKIKFKILKNVSSNSRNSSQSIHDASKDLMKLTDLAIESEARTYNPKNRYSSVYAGVLSLIPGLGHAYLGMWQSALLSFFLTGVSILATYELAKNHQYATATAAGLVGSVFYFGGILSAITSTNELNDKIYLKQRKSIIKWSLPELKFNWVYPLN